MERESNIHGSWFWLRPMLIELVFALSLAALYVWECDGGMMPTANLPLATVHCQFLAHAVLLALMVAATFIDLDEKTIPDSITIPERCSRWAWPRCCQLRCCLSPMAVRCYFPHQIIGPQFWMGRGVWPSVGPCWQLGVMRCFPKRFGLGREYSKRASILPPAWCGTG